MSETILEHLEAINANFQEAREGGFVSIPDAAESGECFDQYNLKAISESNLEVLANSLPEYDNLSDMPDDCLIALAPDASGYYAAWMRTDAPSDHPDLKRIHEILEEGPVLDEQLYSEKLREQFNDDDDYSEWDAITSGDEERMAELQRKETAKSIAYWLNEILDGNMVDPEDIKYDVDCAADKFNGKGETDPGVLLETEIYRLVLKNGNRTIEFFVPQIDDFDSDQQTREFFESYGIELSPNGVFRSNKDGWTVSCSQSACDEELAKKGISLEFEAAPGFK